jgi:Methyltransferase domain
VKTIRRFFRLSILFVLPFDNCGSRRWEGGSTVFMANEIKKQGLPSVVIAVDTWPGSSEHLLEQFNADLSTIHGCPALCYKFLSNIILADVADYVLPLPLDSLNAAQVLKLLHVSPGMIHLDGGHDYESVIADLRVWWQVLAPGGLLIGDDYYTDGTWATVRKAFDDFFGALNLNPIENVAGKCRVQKMLATLTTAA